MRLDTRELEEARRARGTHACPNSVCTFKLNIYIYIYIYIKLLRII
jgi:hypothetical protein